MKNIKDLIKILLIIILSSYFVSCSSDLNIEPEKPEIILQSFTVRSPQHNTVKLIWVTSKEVGENTFTIQNSKDSQTWMNVGTINNNGTPTEYVFTQYNVNPRLVYFYRLEIHNYDTTFYSKPVGIKVSGIYF